MRLFSHRHSRLWEAIRFRYFNWYYCNRGFTKFLRLCRDFTDTGFKRSGNNQCGNLYYTGTEYRFLCDCTDFKCRNNENGKRAACMHILFNIAGALLFGTVGFILFSIYPALAAHNITSVEISVFHTFFNITCTLVMFPFANLLVKFPV